MARSRAWAGQHRAARHPGRIERRAPHEPIDVGVASISGEIDLANAATHGDVLCAILDLNLNTVVVVDCSELELLESQGMAMMHRVHRYGAARGTDVIWAGLAPRHLRVLALSGLDQFLHLEAGPDRGDGFSPPASPPR